MIDVWSRVREASAGHVKQLAPQRPLWSSTSLKVAAVATLLGLGMWIFGSGDGPTTPEQSNEGEARLAARAPLLFRLGLSFLGGFAVGFAFRRFMKVTAMIAAAALAAIGVIKMLGWIDLDWAGVERTVRETLSQTSEGAGAVRSLLKGYLPSAVAGFWGLFKGMRWR
jgi:uncharacterized membrane protein (Fun14 family)